MNKAPKNKLAQLQPRGVTHYHLSNYLPALLVGSSPTWGRIPYIGLLGYGDEYKGGFEEIAYQNLRYS